MFFEHVDHRIAAVYCILGHPCLYAGRADCGVDKAHGHVEIFEKLDGGEHPVGRDVIKIVDFLRVIPLGFLGVPIEGVILDPGRSRGVNIDCAGGVEHTDVFIFAVRQKLSDNVMLFKLTAEIELHIGLTRADPKLADENVVKAGLLVAVHGHFYGVGVKAARSRVKLERPVAVAVGACGLKLHTVGIFEEFGGYDRTRSTCSPKVNGLVLLKNGARA